jgi:hypothetical protein
MWKKRPTALTVSLGLMVSVALSGAPVAIALDRATADAVAGRPLVIHVLVALCDNAHQGIVPVPAKLGKGDDPANNLYWGAQFGVRTWFGRSAEWTSVAAPPAHASDILERRVFRASAVRDGKAVTAYVVADAWRGEAIKATLERFLAMASGASPERVEFEDTGKHVALDAGGKAHAIAFVGHDGLMDFDLPAPPSDPAASPPSAIVLACSSQAYVGPLLHRSGARPILLTTGLMAPEAYTLDAAIRSWLSGASGAAIREAAAAAYDAHQHCGIKGARRLFWTPG